MYDELLTLVTEVEAALNSRSLPYVSSKDVEEPLTPAHLLVGFRIMTLPDPLTPNDDPQFSSGTEGLTRRMTLQKFWKRQRKEYLMELREFHCVQLERGLAHHPVKGEVVTVYNEGHPRGLWRIGRIEDLIKGVDGRIWVCTLELFLRRDVQRCSAGLYNIFTLVKLAR